MSQWTHIAGFLRIDYLQMRESDNQLIDIIKEKFGRTCDFHSPEKSWDECNVPMGSEGSVQYKVLLTYGHSSLARIVVLIWGDLRDYGDDKSIIDWVKKSTKDLILRAGIIQVDVEYRDSNFYGYNGETERWNKIKRILHKSKF